MRIHKPFPKLRMRLLNSLRQCQMIRLERSDQGHTEKHKTDEQWESGFHGVEVVRLGMAPGKTAIMQPGQHFTHTSIGDVSGLQSLGMNTAHRKCNTKQNTLTTGLVSLTRRRDFIRHDREITRCLSHRCFIRHNDGRPGSQ